MARALLGVALAVVALAALSSCSLGDSGDREDGGSSGGEAQALKAEADALAKALLPDLFQALGSSPEKLEARFIERGGFGIWDYEADAMWQVKGKPRLDAVQKVLEDHGLTVERPGTTSDITGTLGNVRVSVSWGKGTAVPVASLRIGSADGVEGNDEYAEQAPPEDYLAYLG